MTQRPPPELVPVPAHLDLHSSLERFRRHGDDLMDRWDGRSFRRPVRIRGVVGAVSLRRQGPALVELDARWGGDQGELRSRVAAMFVDCSAELERLALRDPVVARLLELDPGLCPVRYLDPLGALLGFVTAQQVNLGLALRLRREILQRLGRRLEVAEGWVLCPDPERMALATPEQWAELHLTRAKGRCLGAVGRAVVDDHLDFEALEPLSDDEVRGRLGELPGLGPWTAGQYLTRVLGRPLVVADDLGVRKAVQLAYRLEAMPSPVLVLELTAHWGEAAFGAQQLLLHHLAMAANSAGKGGKRPSDV